MKCIQTHIQVLDYEDRLKFQLNIWMVNTTTRSLTYLFNFSLAFQQLKSMGSRLSLSAGIYSTMFSVCKKALNHLKIKDET
jgi:hypothetical protein